MNKKKHVKSPAPSAPKSAATELLAEQPAMLLDFLLAALSGRSRNSVKSILARGQVSVNGRPTTKYDFPLQPGHRVIVSWAKVAERSEVKLNGLSLMHEDNDLIVVHKEAGLLSIATAQEKEQTAYRQLSDYVRRSNPSARIFIVHRLDRDTSGVMMFAKSERVQQLLQNEWKDAVLERTYVALVEGEVREKEGTVKSWLKENKAMVMYSSSKPDDGQLAITRYKVLKTNNRASLLQVELETGRKNQIRVHMMDIGHPVVGDKKYGSRGGSPIGRLGLHAHVLSFRHPASGETMRFESPMPSSFLRVFREQ
ncbi:RluA family pseudouridine synthase [Paenibacillus ginsengarvi]|uniref:Pseudouridine synthase n=1 Tax=Paenibacillus ginsengarvi TaxID=400777 RepID=A0A3B0BFD9_9BACL|nr:RluA family pseudouridine synthase [Paenibacillus ginsengarvi]